MDCIAKDSSPLDTDQIFGTGFQQVPGMDYFQLPSYLYACKGTGVFNPSSVPI